MAASERFLAVLHRWIEVFMSNSMRRIFQFSKAKGLSMPQIGALLQIHHRGYCTVSQIGDGLGVTNPAASQLLENLVQEDLIDRSEDPNDRRAKQIVLTEKGRRLLRESSHARLEWLNGLTGLLTAQEMTQITSALTLLVEKTRQLENSDRKGS
jgi:DNA-binding MarR family transcriptional regulator